MHKEFFLQFDFILGVKRLVFVEVPVPAIPENVSSQNPEIAKLLEGSENADANADMLVEIAKNEGSTALNAARQEAIRLRAAGGGKLQDETIVMFDKLSTQGKGAASQVSDPAHSDRHMKNVLRNAMEIEKEIAQANPNLNASAPIAETAAIWHDIGRLEDPKEHESLSALMAHNEALRMGFSLETATRMFNAIVHHKWSDQPKTLEGHIVRDADKLDFLDSERWRKRIEGKKYDELRYVTDILLNLRDNLKLEASRKIFDKRLPVFLDFIETAEDKDFEPMKKQILSVFGRGSK
jgi:HD superfamily phosphodiesterase